MPCRSKIEELARREQKRQLLASGAASSGLLRPSSAASLRRSADIASDAALDDADDDIESQLERRERQAERERLKQTLTELGAVNPSAGRGRERLDRSLAEQTQRKLFARVMFGYCTCTCTVHSHYTDYSSKHSLAIVTGRRSANASAAIATS